MAYEPTIWRDGDTITTARLNKLEQGVAGGTLVIDEMVTSPETEDGEYTLSLNKRAAEVLSAAQAGKAIVARTYVDGSFSDASPVVVALSNDVVSLILLRGGGSDIFVAELPDGEFATEDINSGGNPDIK